MRIAIVSPGLHRVQRGAEVALEAIGRELAKIENNDVTLFGSGQSRKGEPYHFIHTHSLHREQFERWPNLPILRDEYAYEEFSFLFNLTTNYNPKQFDVTLTCSYPFVNWWLRRGRNHPTHVYITQNGDHPAQSNKSEYARFGCDGLVCTNQEYFERNQSLWNAVLIPNGVDASRFSPGEGDRPSLDLPADAPVALMVSALISSKRVLEGIKAAAQIPDLHLAICGDGPERDKVVALGEKLMPGRMHLMQLPYEQMPDVYKAADVFLHMSMDEPFGNVYLEALSSGLPIVAHDRDVTRWILEDTSILVDSTRAEETTAGIHRALTQQSEKDIEARRALIEKRFTWQAIGHQYSDFLQGVLRAKSHDLNKAI
ncbi:MAG: glycosyltransferase family 4 protein [Cyanobacteria bacterium J06581_3]